MRQFCSVSTSDRVLAEELLFPLAPCLDGIPSPSGEFMEGRNGEVRMGEACRLVGSSMGDEAHMDQPLMMGSSSSTLVGDAAGRPCFPTLHTSFPCCILDSCLASPLR